LEGERVGSLTRHKEAERAMGYNARNDEIHENLERMRLDRERYEDALAIVRQFNARLSANRPTFMWPTISACARVKTSLARHRM